MQDKFTKIDNVSIESIAGGYAIIIKGKAGRNLKKLAKAIAKNHCGEDTPEDLLCQYFIDDLSKLTDTELFADKVGDIAELRGMSDDALTDILDAVGSIETDTDD